ncbi:PRC-barrel domain-containing protein [Streptomyces sp. HB2AG]|uniref:PRC-barrel domain-containing protein n=1 Tax=Streptomyces sp. HB2AG TaxID=2983400 RepID=UPI0022AA1F35|nr:PRC-barrel domain-containing protein [Streptomyces sp. HB2AG]MCZ2525294.1 PRC-barrel domain-containing protein [Streptomyces sp. HB2AG]
MRLADLIGARVVDPAGREVGHVSDVRLVEERVPGEDAATRLRVDGLVVAVRRRSRLLAYDHRPVRAPMLLAFLARRAAARARWAPWHTVAGHLPPAAAGERGTVRLDRAAADLPLLGDVHEQWTR